jgi:hypothetical protein
MMRVFAVAAIAPLAALPVLTLTFGPWRAVP